MSAAKPILPNQDNRPELRHARRRGFYSSDQIEVVINSKTNVTSGFGSLFDQSVGGLSVLCDAPLDQLAHTEPVALRLTATGFDPLEIEGIYLGQTPLPTESNPKFRLRFCTAQPKSNNQEDQRASQRTSHDPLLDPILHFDHPYIYGMRVVVRIKEIDLEGMSGTSSARNGFLLRGLTTHCHIYFPMIGSHRVQAKISSVTIADKRNDRLRVGFELKSSSMPFLRDLSRFLLLASGGYSFQSLEERGIGGVDPLLGIEFSFAQNAMDLQQIGDLRLKSQNAIGLHQSPGDESSPFDQYDSYSRHIIARKGGEIIGATRMVFNNGNPARMEHSRYGIELPESLIKNGFIESSRTVIDPLFQDDEFFSELFAAMNRTALQTGMTTVVTHCQRSMLRFFQRAGCRIFASFTDHENDRTYFVLILNVAETARGKKVHPLTWQLVNGNSVRFLIRRRQLHLNLWESLRFFLSEIFARKRKNAHKK